MVVTGGKKSLVVLIVEDDTAMRSLLCDAFWSEGYHLREASNGDEALHSVLQSVPDLIVTDLTMPSGGTEYVRRLRAFAPHCPIVVMTAFGDEKTKTRVLEAGATAYVSKPVRISDLKATVKEVVVNHYGAVG